jgi:hypothetical protein
VFGRAQRVTALTCGLFLLALVPATHASNAGRATVTGRLTAKVGKSVTLFQNKDFKVTGTCQDNGGGDFTANTFLQAKKNNLSYTSYGPPTGVDEFSDDFDRADGKIDFTSHDATGTTETFEEGEFDEFYAVGARGRILRGHVATSVHLHGADCGFGGEFVGAARSGPLKAVAPIKVKANHTATIFANKDFKVTGTCEVGLLSNLRANAFVQAKHPHSALYATGVGESTTDFGPADGKIDFMDAAYDANGANPQFIAESYNNDLYLVAGNGRVLQLRIGEAVHWQGSDCEYSGTFIGPKSGNGLKVVNAKKARKGEVVTLFQNRNFRVTGACVDNAPGDVTADTWLTARRPNLTMYSYDGDVNYDFDPADGPADITQTDATGQTPFFISKDQYTDFWGEAARGGGLNGRVATGVHMLGAACVFSGIFAG